MPRSKKGLQRRKKIAGIAKKVAKIAKLTPAGALAVGYAKTFKKNKPKFEKFVKENGIIPSENPEELAQQVVAARAEQIQEIMDDPNNPNDTPEEAADAWEEQQADEIESESYEGESNAFTEEALGAAIGIAKGAIAKIRDKRFAKGKKVLGKSAAQWAAKKGSNIDVDTDGSGNIRIKNAANPNSNDPLSAAVADAKQGAIDANVRKYLPIALIAIVVIFVFFGKKIFK